MRVYESVYTCVNYLSGVRVVSHKEEPLKIKPPEYGEITRPRHRYHSLKKRRRQTDLASAIQSSLEGVAAWEAGCERMN
jgi:hypothetical protein